MKLFVEICSDRLEAICNFSDEELINEIEKRKV